MKAAFSKKAKELFKKKRRQMKQKDIDRKAEESANNKILLLDKRGEPIRIYDKFTFKYMWCLHQAVSLVGSFDWNQDELRYEVLIHGHDRYVCLSYESNGVMFDFSRIDPIREIPKNNN